MAQADMQALGERLAAYIGGRLGCDAEIAKLEQIPGGASRETYRFVLSTPDRERRLILRLDPATSLIETDRRTEFAAIQAFHGTDVPVPEPLWIEDGPDALGAPFFVMSEITGGEANPFKLMQPPYAQGLARMGAQKWSLLGAIAARDPIASGLSEVMPAADPGECWRRELAHWEAMLDADECEPQPVQRAAIRWMRRNPPPSAQKISAVHGDFRTGNILADETGEILGILDWEMAHLGDPLEDLAWSLNRVWHFNRDQRCGGLLPREDAIGLWEKASGLHADADALRWWEVFSCLKGQAIWISAAKEFQTGKNRDSMMALASWMQTNAQDRASLELLGRLGTKEGAPS